MSTDEPTPDPVKASATRQKGRATLLLDAQAVAEAKAAERRAEDRATDARNDARLDAANAATLEQAEKRATDAIAELDRKDKNWKEAMAGKDKTIKFQWMIVAVLIAALLVAVFDKTVGFDWTKGTVNAGGEPTEAAP
jgi:Flp pilus assembly protein TadB